MDAERSLGSDPYITPRREHYRMIHSVIGELYHVGGVPYDTLLTVIELLVAVDIV